MTRPPLRPLLLALAVGSASLLNAAEPAKPAPPAAPPTAGPVITLPPVQVTATRIRELDTAIRKLDKLIAREKKKVKSTELDKTLNNPKLASAAAIFGGNSAEHLSAVAATRVGIMENERMVLEGLKHPGTIESQAALEEQLEQLRVTRRNLDDAAKQR